MKECSRIRRHSGIFISNTDSVMWIYSSNHKVRRSNMHKNRVHNSYIQCNKTGIPLTLNSSRKYRMRGFVHPYHSSIDMNSPN